MHTLSNCGLVPSFLDRRSMAAAAQAISNQLNGVLSFLLAFVVVSGMPYFYQERGWEAAANQTKAQTEAV